MLICHISPYDIKSVEINSNHFFQEYQISSFEERLIKEIEFRIIRITLEELLEEDGEEMMLDISTEESIEPGFVSTVKSYRILDGMGVTFHCKLSGHPMPKVSNICIRIQI